MKKQLSLTLLLVSMSAFALEIPTPQCLKGNWVLPHGSDPRWVVERPENPCTERTKPQLITATYIGAAGIGTLEANFGEGLSVISEKNAFCPAGNGWDWSGDTEHPYCNGDVHTCLVKPAGYGLKCQKN
ncbi:hypothetical protein BH10PSE19_BH10PSE19_05190 [soil metagenome]